MIYVTVTGPGNREVFVNGVYDEVAGTSPLTLLLPPGTHTVETVNGRQEIDFREKVVNVVNGKAVTIVLQAVVPPQKI